MKKFLGLGILILFAVGSAFAQIENPVKWTFSSKKTGDKQYEVSLTATIAPGWHLYAQDPGEGPEPTAITFTKNPLLKEEGKITEDGKLLKEYDPNYNSVLKFYANKVTFTQKFKSKSAAATFAKGSVKFMVCNDKKCLPPKSMPFSIKL